MEPIEQLIRELNEMARIVNENNEVVNQVMDEELNAQGKDSNAAEDAKESKDFFEPDALKNMSQLKRQVTQLIDRQQKKEEEYNKKMQEQIEKQ